jgi:hypothetical protein
MIPKEGPRKQLVRSKTKLARWLTAKWNVPPKKLNIASRMELITLKMLWSKNLKLK